MVSIDEDDLLIRYLTEEATGEEISQVEQWCAMSDENQKTLEQLYFALQVGYRLTVIHSVDHHKALSNLKKRIRQKEQLLRRRLAIQRLQRVAAVLLLPVALFSLWLLLHENETEVQYIELRSNPGMVSSFELPDGSKVWLNGGSRLRYPSVFKGKKREIQMNGQGYFEIARNEQQPFSIKTGDSFSLEVLGTSFNLSAYDDENIIETTLVEGSVRLNLMQNGKMVTRMMKPNEKVVYAKNRTSETIQMAKIEPQKHQIISPDSSIRKLNDPKPESVKVAMVDPQYDIAWKDHQILFRSHPMEEVIRSLGRYYNVQFVVRNEQVMDSEITGKFSNEQLPQVMEYLKIASGIKYHIVPSSVENEEIIPGVVEIWK